MSILVSILTAILTFFGFTQTNTIGAKPAPNTPVQVISNPVDSSSHSLNWAGYEVRGGNFSEVTATWTIPDEGTSGNYGSDATWVGIGGIDSRDLIQAGTMVNIDQSGQTSYQAFWETLPAVAQNLSMTVRAGDSITTDIKQISSGQWQITLADNSTGEKQNINVSYASSLSSAEWIEEAPSGFRRQLPLSNFGTVTFTQATTVVNGQTKTISQAGGEAITMIDETSTAVATPSGLGSDGKSFSVSRTNTSIAQTQTTPNYSSGYIYHRRGFRHRSFY